MIKKLFYLLISLFFVANISFAKTEYFQEGIDIYKQNQNILQWKNQDGNDI